MSSTPQAVSLDSSELRQFYVDSWKRHVAACRGIVVSTLAVQPREKNTRWSVVHRPAVRIRDVTRFHFLSKEVSLFFMSPRHQAPSLDARQIGWAKFGRKFEVCM